MARLLGVPADHLDDVSRWTHAFAIAIIPLADPDQIAAGKEAAGDLLRLFHRLLGQSGALDDGLLQRLASEAKQQGRDATDIIVANGIGFLSQTYEATAALVGNTLLVLAHDRGLAERVKATPALVESLVAEVVRYHSPTQSTRRFVAQDGVVAGQPMRQGDVILVLLAAASHDGAANARPAVFDIDRPDRRLFTFGAGLHACPGRMVATLIAEVAVGYLLQAGLDLARLSALLSYRRSAHLRIPVFGSDLRFDASVAIPNSRGLDGGPVRGNSANFGIISDTRRDCFSALFEFEVREAADPVNVANFKFGTLERDAARRANVTLVARPSASAPRR